MPRTQQVAPGQPYGAAQAQGQAMQAVPLAKAPPVNTAPTPQAPSGGGAAGTAAPVDEAQQLKDLIGQMQGTTPINAPSMRPDEPVTAGMPFGPGPGPEALAPMFAKRNGTADTLDLLAQYTGDAVMSDLARRARERG